MCPFRWQGQYLDTETGLDFQVATGRLVRSLFCFHGPNHSKHPI